MKYDAGMVHFRDDVLAAIRLMLRSNTQITENFSKNDASPAPLRDYIKETYKHRGGAANGVRYQCAPSKGFETFLSRQVNNGGDHKLTLSWSQVAKFVRDNWDDIFSEDEEKEIDEAKPNVTYFEKLKETYPGVTEETLIGTKKPYCPGDFFDGANSIYVVKGDCECGMDCKKCWNSPAVYESPSFDYVEIPDEWKVPSEVCVCENKQLPAFDYGTLDANTAQNLRTCENVIRQQTAEYFTVIGAQLKDAQTLLANHSNGTFEQWYTSLGFKRQTVYNLIQRFDFISSPALGGREEAFEALPVTLSYEISKPDAPKELVEKVLDGDITTNAEYKKLKEELERTKDDLRNVERNFDEREKLRQKLGDENVQLRIKIKEQDKELKSVSEKDTEISSLRQRIEELENRPVDVAVQVDEKALAEKDEEIAELREELEKLQDKKYKPFLIKLTVEEWEELIRVTEKHASRAISTAIKTAKIVRF